MPAPIALLCACISVHVFCGRTSAQNRYSFVSAICAVWRQRWQPERIMRHNSIPAAPDLANHTPVQLLRPHGRLCCTSSVPGRQLWTAVVIGASHRGLVVARRDDLCSRSLERMHLSSCCSESAMTRPSASCAGRRIQPRRRRRAQPTSLRLAPKYDRVTLVIGAAETRVEVERLTLLHSDAAKASEAAHGPDAQSRGTAQNLGRQCRDSAAEKHALSELPRRLERTAAMTRPGSAWPPSHASALPRSRPVSRPGQVRCATRPQPGARELRPPLASGLSPGPY